MSCRRERLEPLRCPQHRASLNTLGISLNGGVGRSAEKAAAAAAAAEQRDIFFDLNDHTKFYGRNLEEGSMFMKPGTEKRVAKFSPKELVVGELLGSGGYNLIFSLQTISLRDEEDYTTTATNTATKKEGNDIIKNVITKRTRSSTPCLDGQLQRLAFATMVNSGNATGNKSHQYVVKFLEPDLKLKRLRSGALDLVREAKMLANMQHDNIISLRGLAEGDNSGGRRQGACAGGGFADGTTTGYFLILDRMEETLLQRCNRWKVAHRSGPLSRFFQKKKKKGKRVRDDDASITSSTTTGTSSATATATEAAAAVKKSNNFFWERFNALVDLASPLVYLHSRLNVAYRDLKPENIGFANRDGTLKLFDFGLAVELNTCRKVSSTSSLYHVGSFGGTHPYIAPEIAKGEPYGLSADTYSFSIICYEVLTMREPFQDLMEHEYTNRVIHGTRRPKFPTSRKSSSSSSSSCWSPELKELLTQCWDANPEGRPTMEEVYSRLQEIQKSNTANY